MTQASTGRRIGAALAAGVLGLALTACSGPDNTVTSEPAATVEVDVFSGRQNPEVPLSPGAAEQLTQFIAEHEQDATSVDEPEWPLGFRGFVVTFDDAQGSASWASVRVQPNAVYVDDGANLLRITDSSGTAYSLVWTDIQDDLAADVREAIEQSN